MKRTIVPFLAVLVLAACSGGGSTGALTPSAPIGPTQAGKATLAIKIPSKSLMTALRRPFYQSQATAGIAFTWNSSDPTHPDLAFPVSATCPSPLPQGITSCSIDSTGSTIYQFTIDITPGTYPNFKVTTFDTAPTGASPTTSTFSTAAHVLSQAALPTPITIVSGKDTTLPNMTFYGIPQSVSLIPYPSQSHVQQTGQYSYQIVGNAQQDFGVAALDAGGFLIGSTDSGAPTITVSEGSSDSPQEFAIAKLTGANEYGIGAIAAAASPQGTITVTATAGASGFAPVSATYTIVPIQEMWITQSTAGATTGYGLAGYPLDPPGYAPVTPMDFTYDDPTLNACGVGVSCSWRAATQLPDTSFVAASATNGHLYRFVQGTGSEPPAFPQQLPTGYTSTTIAALAADNAGHIYIADNSANGLVMLPSATSTAVVVPSLSPMYPDAIAIAPSLASIPSSLQQTAWVANYSVSQSPIFGYYVNGSGMPTDFPVTVIDGQRPLGIVTALGFDANGYLWAFDGSSIHVYSISGTTSNATATELLTTPYAPTTVLSGASFGATAQGAMWLASFGSASTITQFTLSGCPTSCTVMPGTTSYLNADADSAIVVP